jgi:glutamate-5-semialdehyde dehydrogenase
MDEGKKELILKAKVSKAASKRLAYISTEIKNRALNNIADDLLAKKNEILAANNLDYNKARESGMNIAMLDRLLLTEERIKSMSQDVLSLITLPDPVGDVIETHTLPNGLIISKRRVPLGVIGAIYESRPNVTIDISSLSIKSGNSTILRGGKESIHSNSTLAKLVQEAAARANIPNGAVQFIESTDRDVVNQMLNMGNYIDVIIPRGGVGLINYVKENSIIPVVAGGIGVCHIYVDRNAEIDQALAISYNAKVQRPTVCNALDCLLVHKDIAMDYLPRLATEFAKEGVEIHCDENSMSILKSVSNIMLTPATDLDWGKEFLSLVIAIKIVSSIDEALEHIEQYSSGHSEAIVTNDYYSAMRFLNEVDAACVYVNASTRFTDGAQFGLGAELGISTQKIHARGPIGLKEITSYKWVVFGSGQVRL